jgi:hypothetical protein
VTTVLALIALLATVFWTGVLVSLHVLPTGYAPVRNAVSDYGVGRYRGYYRAQTGLAAVAAVALAAALGRAFDPAPALLVVLLLVFAAARLAIPSFPTDLDRSRPTRTGRIHIVLAGLAFGAIAWAAAATPDRVPWPDGTHDFLVALGWVVVAAAVACGLAMSSRLHAVTEPFFGLVERVFYLAVLVWFVVVSVKLL